MSRPPLNMTMIGALTGLGLSAAMFTGNAIGLIPPMPRNLAVLLLIGTTATGSATGRFADLRFAQCSSSNSAPTLLSTSVNVTHPDIMLYQQGCKSAFLHLNSLDPHGSQYPEALSYVAVLLANGRVALAEQSWSATLAASVSQLATDLEPNETQSTPNVPSADERSDAPTPTDSSLHKTWLDEPEIDRTSHNNNAHDDRSIEFIA
jgi:hypothetical protein